MATLSNGWEMRSGGGMPPAVIPMSDLKEHNDGECWCRPVDDDGVMMHNALDEREAFEHGWRLVS